MISISQGCKENWGIHLHFAPFATLQKIILIAIPEGAMQTQIYHVHNWSIFFIFLLLVSAFWVYPLHMRFFQLLSFELKWWWLFFARCAFTDNSAQFVLNLFKLKSERKRKTQQTSVCRMWSESSLCSLNEQLLYLFSCACRRKRNFHSEDL